MDTASIAIRALFTYVTLLILLRLSGKRIVAESTVFDFILALIVGDLVDDVIFGEEPASIFVAVVGTLILLELISRLLSRSFPRLDSLLEGRPNPLLKDGIPIVADMRKSLISYRELRAMLRLKGFLVRHWKEIRISLLEQNGHASVLRKEESSEAQKRDLEK